MFVLLFLQLPYVPPPPFLPDSPEKRACIINLLSFLLRSQPIASPVEIPNTQAEPGPPDT